MKKLNEYTITKYYLIISSSHTPIKETITLIQVILN